MVIVRQQIYDYDIFDIGLYYVLMLNHSKSVTVTQKLCQSHRCKSGRVIATNLKPLNQASHAKLLEFRMLLRYPKVHFVSLYYAKLRT